MTREADIEYQQALDVVAARMLHWPIVTLHHLMEAVEVVRARHKATRERTRAALEMGEDETEQRQAELRGRANSTRKDAVYSEAVASGRVPHPNDIRI